LIKLLEEPPEMMTSWAFVQLYISWGAAPQERQRLGAPLCCDSEGEAREAAERGLKRLYEYGQLSVYVRFDSDTCFFAVIRIPGKRIMAYLFKADGWPIVNWDESKVGA
jgi:hypothetical protein